MRLALDSMLYLTNLSSHSVYIQFIDLKLKYAVALCVLSDSALQHILNGWTPSGVGLLLDYMLYLTNLSSHSVYLQFIGLKLKYAVALCVLSDKRV